MLPNSPLAIKAHKDQILSQLNKHSVVVISGLTGCGKSTQAPQYILDAHPGCKVAICQPRLLAAISLAKRVIS